ncbi:molecular chaperone DnaJ [Halobacteriales archaeon QS_6_64_34]|nr:MAG: molecular chaperone DnaJ [Halobacteriales archaeon QS_6_64_34]
MTETFYDVLGVAEDATTDEIETAYRERLKQTHPDVSDDEDASRATKTLIEARDVLVDEDERARYDRVGHDAYVSDGPTPSANDGAETSGRDGEADAGGSRSGTGGSTRSRTRREQRASERVRQERKRAREAGQERHQANTEASEGERTASATAADSTYSVREDIERTSSHGPLLPRGRQLTLLGLFFPLYPVLLFSALLPAFPPFVNLILSACTLLTIIYLQSMPRVALCVFGVWSGISLVGLAVFGIGYFSAVGLVVLASTMLPFGFSVLTASALRY